MAENILTKKVLDTFFAALEKEAAVPADIKAKLIELRSSNKLLKGDHLKTLLETSVIAKEGPSEN